MLLKQDHLVHFQQFNLFLFHLYNYHQFFPLNLLINFYKFIFIKKNDDFI